MDASRNLGERPKNYKVAGVEWVVWRAAGRVHAAPDACPHMGASLSAGHVEQEMVICPWHAWRFSICDGSWVENPKLKVDSFEVRLEGNEIQVAVEPLREVALGDGEEVLT